MSGRAVLGGEDLLPIEPTEHDWLTPYPPFGTRLPLRWEKGQRRSRPNFYWYPSLWHWVCDLSAFELLRSVVPKDIHVIAQADVDGEPAWVVQVVNRLDGVVDRAASLIDRYSTYEIMQWPSFYRSAAERVSDKLFGLPEMTFDVFLGERVKAAFEAAGLTGLRYVTVDWTNDLSWTATARTADEAWAVVQELASSTSWPRGVPVALAHVARLLRVDRRMRQHGLLLTLVRCEVDDVDGAALGADYLGLADVATAVLALPQWTKPTLDDVETAYLAAVGSDRIREACRRRFEDSPEDF